MLRGEFGAKGMYMLDYILCEIYRTNGYYLQWDDKRRLLLSDGAGCDCDPNFIREFVAGCIRCSFFDERVLHAFGVLTSAGIQRRYVRMHNSRDHIYVRDEYWLLDLKDPRDVPAGVLNKLVFVNQSSTEKPDKSTENPDKSTEKHTNQSKLNKSKRDHSKSFPSSEERIESEAKSNGKRDVIRLGVLDQIEYSIFADDAAVDLSLVGDLAEIMVDVLSSNKKSMVIGGEEYPTSTVKSRFRALDHEHIVFVLDCMHKNTSEIRNIRKYLLTALFNAPVTMNSYYAARVSHDFAK